jgi:hypothetical protein
MKYTVDEERKTITIHNFGSNLKVYDLTVAFEGYENFEIICNCNTDQSGFSSNGRSYENYTYVPESGVCVNCNCKN